MLKRSSLSAITGAAIAMLATTSGTAQTEKLRVGVEGNYPPFSMISPDGKPGGFDVDIPTAICTKMKADCSFVQQEFDGIIPAPDARKKAVDFSDPY